MASSPVLPETRLIGRERILEQLDATLARAPTVVKLAAQPSMGKSAVVRAFAANCGAKGWVVVGPAPGDARLIGPRTTKEQFLSRLAQIVSAVDATSRLAAPSSTSLTSENSTLMRNRRLPAEVAALAGLAPAVLVVEDFDADQRFAGWFERGFLSEVLQSGRKLLVLMTGLPADLEPLLDVGETIELGPLDDKAVRATLEEIGSRLRPPLEPAELRQYVLKATASPSLMASLAVVLPLAEG